MLVLHHLTSSELQRVVNSFRNRIWAANGEAVGVYCGIVLFGFGSGRGKFEIVPGQIDGFSG
jgi:hypothetical protein